MQSDDVTIDYQAMETILRQFVIDTCGSRDASHDHEHSERVVRRARDIYAALVRQPTSPVGGRRAGGVDGDRVLRMIIAAAWLHDVLDHKYVAHGGPGGGLGDGDSQPALADRVRALLEKFFTGDDAAAILRAIERVSYSREVRLGRHDWAAPGTVERLVRDVVSDADKLDALGEVGVQRCIEYTLAREQKQADSDSSAQRATGAQKPADAHAMLTLSQLYERVVAHAEEKLLRMRDGFMTTAPGREMAGPLHDEMVAALREMRAKVE